MRRWIKWIGKLMPEIILKDDGDARPQTREGREHPLGGDAALMVVQDAPDVVVVEIDGRLNALDSSRLEMVGE